MSMIKRMIVQKTFGRLFVQTSACRYSRHFLVKNAFSPPNYITLKIDNGKK